MLIYVNNQRYLVRTNSPIYLPQEINLDVLQAVKLYDYLSTKSMLTKLIAKCVFILMNEEKSI